VGPPLLVARPAAGIAFSPDGERVYVASGGTRFGPDPIGRVWTFDTASSREVAAPVPVGHHPIGIALTGDGTRAYVANYDDGTVSVIDTANNAVVQNPTGNHTHTHA
jgi:YVTN family beta-propeller protein